MFVVEDGTGRYEANSYAGLAYAQSYLGRRNRTALWDAATREAQEAALIAATDYIDKRFGRAFLGQKEFQNVDVCGYNFLKVLGVPQEDDTLTVGAVVYTFKNTPTAPQEVLIGSTIEDSVLEMVNALNTDTTIMATNIDENVDTLIIYHRLVGEQPEVLTSTSDNSRLVWDYPMLIGGANSIEQILEFPRDNLFSRYGNQIKGIPDKLRQATVEYASRALSSGLMPDPETSATGQEVRRVFEKVGPIESEVAYSSAVSQIFKKFPEADKLLVDLISSNGGVIR